jgi:hypothetical protein
MSMDLSDDVGIDLLKAVSQKPVIVKVTYCPYRVLLTAQMS